MILVHETCECGAVVARKLVRGATQVVWCGACRREFNGNPCGVPGCEREASTYLRTHGHATPICPLHRAGAEALGLAYGKEEHHT